MWDVASSMHAVHALCGLLQPSCGMLKPLRGLRTHHVVCHILYGAATGAMCAIVVSMWAVEIDSRVQTPFRIIIKYLHPFFMGSRIRFERVHAGSCSRYVGRFSLCLEFCSRYGDSCMRHVGFHRVCSGCTSAMWDGAASMQYIAGSIGYF